MNGQIVVNVASWASHISTFPHIYNDLTKF